jgi:crotonobetainyl-CoA:carnitine CoA-transferase CaiB-like acyl-CoA transferase
VDDERFIDMASRLKNIDESYKITSEIIASRSRKEWLDLLGDTKIPNMVVNSLDDLIDEPQLVESGFWQAHDHPTEGTVRMASPPINFEQTPASIRRLPPMLGQHSVEVLLEAGLDQKNIDALIANGELKTIDQNTG